MSDIIKYHFKNEFLTIDRTKIKSYFINYFFQNQIKKKKTKINKIN